MLTRRLISAGIIISVMIALVVLDHWLGRPSGWGRPGLVISLVTTFACVVAAGELVNLWAAGGIREVRLAPTLGGVLIMAIGACWPMLSPWLPGQMPLLAADGAFRQVDLMGGTVCGLVAAMAVVAWTGMASAAGEAGARTSAVARSMLAIVWMTALVGFLAPHRLLHGHNGSGICALVAILTSVKMSDAFAYGSGKLWGRSRLAPALSPNKTIEGAIGGLAGGIFGALIVFWFVAPWVAGPGFARPLGWIAGYGLVLALAGLLGDLFESMLKRDAGCKDSSAWLPGLGGVMDIVDSIVFAAPASWLYWMATGAANLPGQ